MSIQDQLKDMESIEVLQQEEVHEYLRERRMDEGFNSKELEDGRIECFRSTPIVSEPERNKKLLRVEADEAKILAELRGVEWRDIYSDRVIRQWGSDERVDRHGDIVLQDWNFKEFEKNPAMPFNHDWNSLPVGVHLDWEVVPRATAEYVGPALLLTSLFAAADEMVPELGDSLFRLVSSGMLRANSVGFVPGKIIQVNDEEERDRLGLGRWGDILAENILLENSPTLLGANQGAMVILNSAKEAGNLMSPDLTLIRELSRLANLDSPDAWQEEDEKWRGMARMLFPSEKFTKAKDIDQPFIDTQIEFEELEDENYEETIVILDKEDKSDMEDSTQPMEEAILEKLTQLTSLIEMSTLSLQTQLDALADSLMDDKDCVEGLSKEKQRAISLIKSIQLQDLGLFKPKSFAAELADLVHSSDSGGASL